MSKVFEVRIRKHRTANSCGFKWPWWWDKVVTSVQVLAYEDHPEREGDSEEYAVCITSDPTWKKINQLDDPAEPRVREISDEEANEKGRACRPQITRMLDPKKVMAIAEKIGKGQAISPVEKKALDPDDDEIGLGKSNLFDIAVIKRHRGDD